MLRVTLDTNIYISAVLFGGKPDEILDLAREGKIRVVISEKIISEITEILGRKFRAENWRVQKIVRHIRRFTTLVVPGIVLEIITKHKQDNRILECAVESRADYIVSGDKKHILSLKEFQGIRIMSPKELLEIFYSKRTA